MRLVNRRLMLQEPVSTIYSAWIPNSYVELRIFMGPTSQDDWASIAVVDGIKTALFLDPVYVKSIPRFVPEPGDTASQLYLIWEAADINKTLARMQAAQASIASQVTEPMGD